MPETAPLFKGIGYPVLQNRTFASRSEALACATGDIELTQDGRTGLVHNAAFESDLVVYDQGYDNEQGHSQAFRDHLLDVRRRIGTHFAGRKLLEVGCGKGLFLEMLIEAGFDVIGVDPSYTGDNPRVVRDFFGPELGVKADCIVLRHVLEHIPNPVSFLRMIANANDGGLIYVEVPCLDWIAQKRAWFDIFYEHVNYFRLSDLEAMFGQVLAAERIFGGQYLGIFADLATLKSPSIEVTGPFRLPDGFLSGLKETAEALAGGDYAVWGGASKGVVFSLLMSQYGLAPLLAIDINPAKQDRYMPVSGVGIVSPQVALASLGPGSSIVVMNDNYLDETRALAGDRFNLLTVTK